MTENNTCTSSKCLIKFVWHPAYTAGYLLIMSIVNTAQNSSLMSSEQLSPMLTCSYSLCLTIIVKTSYNLDITAGQLWYLLNVVNNDIKKELLELASSSTGNLFLKASSILIQRMKSYFKDTDTFILCGKVLLDLKIFIYTCQTL